MVSGIGQGFEKPPARIAGPWLFGLLALLMALVSSVAGAERVLWTPAEGAQWYEAQVLGPDGDLVGPSRVLRADACGDDLCQLDIGELQPGLFTARVRACSDPGLPGEQLCGDWVDGPRQVKPGRVGVVVILP